MHVQSAKEERSGVTDDSLVGNVLDAARPNLVTMINIGKE